jgi:hypothetical protein
VLLLVEGGALGAEDGEFLIGGVEDLSDTFPREGRFPALEANLVLATPLLRQRFSDDHPVQPPVAFHGALLGAQVGETELPQRSQSWDLADEGFWKGGGDHEIDLVASDLLNHWGDSAEIVA